MDADVVKALATFVPLCVAASGVLIWAIRTRPANVTADTAALEAQWRHELEYIERLEARCRLHEREKEECHRERDEWRARALKAEAASEGIGMVRTAQAIADAERRATERGDQ